MAQKVTFCRGSESEMCHFKSDQSWRRSYEQFLQILLSFPAQPLQQNNVESVNSLYFLPSLSQQKLATISQQFVHN